MRLCGFFAKTIMLRPLNLLSEKKPSAGPILFKSWVKVWLIGASIWSIYFCHFVLKNLRNRLSILRGVTSFQLHLYYSKIWGLSIYATASWFPSLYPSLPSTYHKNLLCFSCKFDMSIEYTYPFKQVYEIQYHFVCLKYTCLLVHLF